MAGVKGRSGGNGKKSIAEHIANGTYRKDRHGSLVVMQPAPPQSLRMLALNSDEKETLNYLRQIIPNIQPSMAIHLSLLAHDLTLYMQAHSAVLESGIYVEDWKGNRVLSPAFRARERLLRQVRTDLVSFSLSSYQQAVLMDKITSATNRIAKPKPGVPLE